MVGERVGFLCTSYESRRMSERSERVSLAIFHNKCIINNTQVPH